MSRPKQVVAFLKKSSAKDFCNRYTGCFNVPRLSLAKVFCGAFLQKSDRFLASDRAS